MKHPGRRGLLTFLVGTAIPLLAASTASAAFVAPTFIRQWDAGPIESTSNVASVATDPFGDVYVLKTVGGGQNRVLKFHHDGTPVAGQWAGTFSGGFGAIATDPQGHVYVGAGLNLREFTSGGGLLATYTPTRFQGDALAIDAAGNIYANGKDANGQKAVNEYTPAGPTLNLVHSAAYPGTPNGGFAPSGFLGLTVDPAGNVYGSGVSTTNRFLAKYTPPLSGFPSYLDNCDANADPPTCFGGFGIAFANADVSSTGPTQPTVFSASGFLRKLAGFYDVGVFSTEGASPNHFLGSYQEAPVPGGFFTNVGSVAAAPCHAAVYSLVNVFGNPGTTLSGWVVQEFDTHAAPTACATGFTASVGGFKKKYVLRKPGGTVPCTPCAPILRSGAFAAAAAGSSADAITAKKKSGGGVNIAYTSSAAADTTFLFKRLGVRGRKSKLGGFIYAAHAGRNQLRFSGTLRKHKTLVPGSYRVTVSAGVNRARFKLVVPRNP